MAQRIVFLHTSFVIALENKDDPHHARAKSLDVELMKEDAALIFHWGILIEIADGFARVVPTARRCSQNSRVRQATTFFLSPNSCFKKVSVFTLPGRTRNGV